LCFTLALNKYFTPNHICPAAEKKKAAAGQTIFRALMNLSVAALIFRAAVSFCFDDPYTVFWHGGFRRKPPCQFSSFTIATSYTS